jgi:hypothetical protein
MTGQWCKLCHVWVCVSVTCWRISTRIEIILVVNAKHQKLIKFWLFVSCLLLPFSVLPMSLFPIIRSATRWAWACNGGNCLVPEQGGEVSACRQPNAFVDPVDAALQAFVDLVDEGLSCVLFLACCSVGASKENLMCQQFCQFFDKQCLEGSVYLNIFCTQ